MNENLFTVADNKVSTLTVLCPTTQPAGADDGISKALLSLENVSHCHCTLIRNLEDEKNMDRNITIHFVFKKN